MYRQLECNKRYVLLSFGNKDDDDDDDDDDDHDYFLFFPAWMYIGMVGGYLFILLQLILLIDFAYNWSESW